MADRNLDGGRLWSLSNIGLAIPANNSFYFALVTNDKDVKFSSRQFSSAGDDIAIWFYEGLTFTGGAAAKIVNRNRHKSDLIPTFQVFGGITPSEVINDPADPRVLSVVEYKSNNNNYIQQNLNDEDNKWLFERNSTYIVRLQNADAGAAQFSSTSTFEELYWSHG